MRDYGTKELTAYCGLYCRDCIRFNSRSAALAAELLGALDQERYAEYAADKVKGDPASIKGVSAYAHYDQALELLRALADGMCRRPCRLGGDGCAADCRVKTCCLAKGLEGCWQCEGFDQCPELSFLLPITGPNLIDNLRIIKEEGPDEWAPRRRNYYHWQD